MQQDRYIWREVKSRHKQLNTFSLPCTLNAELKGTECGLKAIRSRHGERGVKDVRTYRARVPDRISVRAS